jgi:hypothetical protein
VESEGTGNQRKRSGPERWNGALGADWLIRQRSVPDAWNDSSVRFLRNRSCPGTYQHVNSCGI